MNIKNISDHFYIANVDLRKAALTSKLDS